MSLMKGVELGTLKRMSEVIAEVTGAGPERIAVLTGPNLAREIAAREPAASVVACASEPVADQLREWLHGPRFRPYSSVDVVGCELGGAYKNVIALAVGMAVGLGFGDNTTASLITRGLAETARLAVKLGADPLTLMGLAGMGDLVATCSSPLSRNRTFGEKLGKGMTTEEITASTRQVAEGVKSAASILALARAQRDLRPARRGRPRRRGGRVDHPRDDGELRLARDQARARLTAPPGRDEARPSSAVARSAQRSSTSSMPTEARTSASGIVAASDFHRRRRSKVDSTPPRLVACTHSRVERHSRSAASGPPGRHERDDGAEAGVADLADLRVLAQPLDEHLGVGLGPVQPHRQRAQPAQRQPGLERARAPRPRGRAASSARRGAASSDTTSAPRSTSL